MVVVGEVFTYEDDCIRDNFRAVFNSAVVGGNHRVYGALGVVLVTTLWCVLQLAGIIFRKIFTEDDSVTRTLARDGFILGRLPLGVKQVRRERGQIFCECFYEALKCRLVLDFREASLSVTHLGLLPLKPNSRGGPAGCQNSIQVA